MGSISCLPWLEYPKAYQRELGGRLLVVVEQCPQDTKGDCNAMADGEHLDNFQLNGCSSRSIRGHRNDGEHNRAER